MTRKGDPRSLEAATRGMKPVVKPTERQKDFVKSLPGANTAGLRRAQQIVRQRQQTPYVSPQWVCITCLAPRERKSFPVCEACSAKRIAGLR